jgi:hypothetical protein
MATTEIECFGGPLDGKRIPCAIDNDETGFMTTMNRKDNQPHYYVVREDEDGERTLHYAGTTAEQAVARMREFDTDAADNMQQLFAGLESFSDKGIVDALGELGEQDD